MSTQVSKQMSYILRHDPASVGLSLQVGGWVEVEDLTSALGISTRELMKIVKEDSKGRYSVQDGKIRANQGHSIPVDLELSDMFPPEILFHGTVERALKSIFEEGLLRQKRHAVHLSPNPETASDVGKRRGKPVILSIKAGEMSRQGFIFQVSENGVWLTSEVPPAFIERLS